MNFDVAIIGAGFSGLAAGIRLAHFGKRVAILEKHTVWGGLNSFYKKDGHHFDTGLHAVTNYVRPGYKGPRLPLQRICRQLRVGLEEFALEPQTYSEVVFGDARLRFANDISVLEDEVRRVFPREVEGFRKLRAACANYPDLTRDAPHVSSRAMLREFFAEPLCVEMLLAPVFWYGSAEEHDIDFEQLIILFKSIYEEGFARPRRGIRQILDVLVKKFADAGGAMLKGNGVSKIEVAGDRVTGLVLEDGERVEAPIVLSSAGRVETMKLCGRAVQGTGSLAFVETVWVLPAKPASDACVTFFSSSPSMRWASPSAPVDFSSGVICSPSSYAHAEGPAEHQLRATHLANPSFWLNADAERYASEKAAFIARSRETIARFTGPLDPSYTDAFTPRTVKHYTGKENGAIYGSPAKLKTGRTELANLFLCGTDQGLAGIVGAMLSGINMANAHVLMSGE